MQDRNYQQAAIRLGTHGENYGSWMSNPVFYVVGGLFALAVVLAVLSLNGSVEPDKFLTIATMVVAFYFGTQNEKKS